LDLAAGEIRDAERLRSGPDISPESHAERGPEQQRRRYPDVGQATPRCWWWSRGVDHRLDSRFLRLRARPGNFDTHDGILRGIEIGGPAEDFGGYGAFGDLFAAAVERGGNEPVK